MCGAAVAWSPHAARYTATLRVVLRAQPAGADAPVNTLANATVHGSFTRGLQHGHEGWDGAQWIGLADANDNG